MYMKKTLIILFVCILLTITCACANSSTELASSVPQYDYEYTTLEQLSDKAEIIVTGTVESVEQADDSNYFYCVNDLSVIRGQCEDPITIYGNSDLINKGGQYCLFLYQNDSEFWPKPLTLFVNSESVFELVGDSIVAPERFGLGEMDTATFMNEVANLPAPQSKATTVIDALSYEELLNQSTAIFTATVEDVTYSSPYAGGTANISIVDVFKGTLDEKNISILVPQGLQSGETYLFFRTNDLSDMPSRNNSVISAESDEYAQIIELIQ
jgi:hypothetical protein